MALDLSLLPFFKGTSFSHSVIQTERGRELFEEIKKISAEYGRDVPEDFNCYKARVGEVPGYGSVSEDKYGEKLKYVKASDLVKLSAHEEVTDSAMNSAVWAYLKEIPKMNIALFWE